MVTPGTPCPFWPSENIQATRTIRAKNWAASRPTWPLWMFSSTVRPMTTMRAPMRACDGTTHDLRLPNRGQ